MRNLIDELTKGQKPDPEPDKIELVYITCDYCRNRIDRKGLCSKCATMYQRGYDISYKTGRCANGAQRDIGPLYHARIIEPGEKWPKHNALCGTRPGKRSGWSGYSGTEVTCTQCIKKLEKSK